MSMMTDWVPAPSSCRSGVQDALWSCTRNIGLLEGQEIACTQKESTDPGERNSYLYGFRQNGGFFHEKEFNQHAKGGGQLINL